jgi:hypothetical protein
MSALDKIANTKALCREYYGYKAMHKPNDHCFWDDECFIIGWRETDEHFRKRIQTEKGKL